MCAFSPSVWNERWCVCLHTFPHFFLSLFLSFHWTHTRWCIPSSSCVRAGYLNNFRLLSIRQSSRASLWFDSIWKRYFVSRTSLHFLSIDWSSIQPEINYSKELSIINSKCFSTHFNSPFDFLYDSCLY